MSSAFFWSVLPTEMKWAIFDRLDALTLLAFSKTNKGSYSLCVPYTFRNVNLKDFASLRHFVKHVPTDYYKHILKLHVCTKGDSPVSDSVSHPRTDALASILSRALRLENLSLCLEGSLEKKIIPYFASLFDLSQLAISNWGEESNMPISERLVVSIAASVPSLQILSLDHITRSSMHAPDLIGGYSYVPLVDGDGDIPSHPLLGTELSLPSLLQIPSLKQLTIRDTHLGDPLWPTTPVACKLETLDLGSCYRESDAFNATCVERIMSAVGPSVSEFTLTTAVRDESFAVRSATPLKKLRKLHISPYFPVEAVGETISGLAGSPIESLSMQCFSDDVADVCHTLEAFLNLRVERGSDSFYEHLSRIDLSVVKEVPADRSADDDDDQEWREAARQLQDYCNDLRLKSAVVGVSADAVHQHHPAPVGCAGERASDKTCDGFPLGLGRAVSSY